MQVLIRTCRALVDDFWSGRAKARSAADALEYAQNDAVGNGLLPCQQMLKVKK